MEAALQRYLREHIPLSVAMGVEVEVASPARILLRAPLGPNANHIGTAFGGAIGALAILAGWSWLWTLLRERSPRPEIVVARAATDYLRPAEGDFTAEVRPPSDEAIARFLEALDRRGKGRLEIVVEVISEGEVVARFVGDYVATAR